MTERRLMLTIVEEDGSQNSTWVAAWPIRPEPRRVRGTDYEWPADNPEAVGEFFKNYIVREWSGIISKRDPHKKKPGAALRL